VILSHAGFDSTILDYLICITPPKVEAVLLIMVVFVILT